MSPASAEGQSTQSPAATRVRLPLQVGTSSLGHAAAAASLVVPGGWLAGSLAFCLRAQIAPGALWLLGPVGGYLAVFGLLEIRHAWRSRASDLLLDVDGFAIEGGVHDGLRLRWNELDVERSRAETQTVVRLTLGKIVGDVFFLVFGLLLADKLELAPEERVPLRRLFVVTLDGRERMLAEAVHPAEQASIDALMSTLTARLRPRSTACPVTAPDVLACARCGAPLTPVDAEEIGCAFCGAPNSMPPELRARLRAVVEATRSKHGVARALAELLQQPGARAASSALALAAASSLAVWGAVVAVLLIAGLHDVGAFDTAALLTAGLALTSVAFVWARAGLARRRALHLITAAYGARPPRDGGAAWTCRQCGGALPASEHLVAGCAHCGADNVLGVDLRPEAALGRAQLASLADVLAAASGERARLLRLAVAGVAVAVVAASLGLVQLESARRVRRLRDACARQDATSCRKLGDAYAVGIDTAKDAVKSCGAYERACALDDLESCDQLAGCAILGLDRPSDVEAGERIRRRACEQGYEPACKRLEE